MADLRRKWFVDMSACTTPEEASASDMAAGLSIENVYAVFSLLAVGIGISFLW